MRADRSGVVAVVVSFNRRTMLLDCLRALESQTRRPDHVIVVDNGSTDGSVDAVLAEFPEVEVFRSEENLGGAGGFSFAVEQAQRARFEAAWLMDDDAEPVPDALRELLSAADRHPDAPFLTSAVRFYGGTVEAARLGGGLRWDLIGESVEPHAVHEATFVGVLVRLEAAAKTFLPVDSFFIWHDDSEYTRRLAKEAAGVRVPSSGVLHPFKAEYLDFGWKLYYDIRNRIWTVRTPALGSRALKREHLAALPRIVVSQAVRSKDKRAYLGNVLRGVRDGLLHRPQPPVSDRQRFVRVGANVTAASASGPA